MAVIEQLFFRNIRVGVAEAPLGVPIILYQGQTVSDGGVRLPAGKQIKIVGPDRIEGAWTHQGVEGTFALEGKEEINSSPVRLATRPNRWGFHKEYFHATSSSEGPLDY